MDRDGTVRRIGRFFAAIHSGVARARSRRDRLVVAGAVLLCMLTFRPAADPSEAVDAW